MEEKGSGRTWSAANWVLIVVVIGLALGTALALTVHVPQASPPAGPPGAPPPPTAVTQANVLLSTLCLVLLASLLAVYVRSYLATRAPYVLGLVIFLVALFFETALNSPLLFTAFGLGPGSLGRFLALSDLVLSGALSIFLYLSLQ
jgi:hypothetical protein